MAERKPILALDVTRFWTTELVGGDIWIEKELEVPVASPPEYFFNCGNYSCDENGWRALTGRRVITGACNEQRLQWKDYGLE
jgi:hypothetical protein